MKKNIWVVGLVVFSLAFGLWLAWGADQPFPGKYRMVGEAADLLAGEKILVEDFLSPICSNCYLYWKNSKPLGDDVELKVGYVFAGTHGELPVRLLLVAREQGSDAEVKMLKTLFNAKFVHKVNTEDPEIIDGIAASMGLGDVWQKKKDSPELKAEMAKLAEYLQERGVEKAPRIFIQKAILVSTGTCGCYGDGLPPVVEEVLANLRQYRQAHRP